MYCTCTCTCTVYMYSCVFPQDGKTKEKTTSKSSPKEGGEKKEVEVVGPTQEDHNQLQEG